MSMGELTKGQNVQLLAVRVSTCNVVHAVRCFVRSYGKSSEVWY